MVGVYGRNNQLCCILAFKENLIMAGSYNTKAKKKKIECAFLSPVPRSSGFAIPKF